MHIVLTGGGTGGHVVPNIAIADAIKSQAGEKTVRDTTPCAEKKSSSGSGGTSGPGETSGSGGTSGPGETSGPGGSVVFGLRVKNPKISYIGSKKGIENKLIDHSEMDFFSVWTGKLRRYFSFENFIDLFKIPIGVLQAFFILKKLKPDVVFSKCGFVGFPVVLGARLARIPVFIHESDAIPGLATKLSAPFVKKILLGYKEAGKYLKKYKNKTEIVGNPVRREMFAGSKERAQKLTGFKGDKPVVLIMGGSGGAEQINTIVKKEMKRMTEVFDLIHLRGGGEKSGSKSFCEKSDHGGTDREKTEKKQIKKNHEKDVCKKKGYFSIRYADEEMKDFYALASLALTRAGANSLAELEALNIPSLLYPLGRYASRGDQMANARAMIKKNKIFILADEKKDAHSQLIMLPERVKKESARGTDPENSAKKIAEILIRNAL